MRIGSVDVRLGEEANLDDYSLPKSAPTIDTVEEVMQLFESGGKVPFVFSCQVLEVNERREGARLFFLNYHDGGVLKLSPNPNPKIVTVLKRRGFLKAYLACFACLACPCSRWCAACVL